jgi:hypothetical protein
VKCPAPAGHFSFVRNGPLREGVGDSTGSSRFLLSRTLSVSDDLYRQLLNRASVKGGARLAHPDPPAAGGAGRPATYPHQRRVTS